jgi:hypothetical protein
MVTHYAIDAANDAEKQNDLPEIKWIKNDPKKHQWFYDGSVFLVALRTGKTGGPYKWDFETVTVSADGESMSFNQRECGCDYSSWSWEDFEYFHVLEGQEPTTKPDNDE